MAKKGQYTYEYPHPAVAADCVVFGYDGKELKVLLIKRGAEKEASTTAHPVMAPGRPSSTVLTRKITTG